MSSPLPSSSTLLTLLTLLLPLLPTTLAASCDLSSGCPSCGMDYSPFRPWFTFTNASSRQLCWQTIDCTLSQSGEERKQQYAAIALIMGLIPLTLKDVAWPACRTIPLSAPLPAAVEVLVRALSLEPDTTPEEAGEWWRRRGLARWAGKGGRGRAAVLLGAFGAALVFCYAALALVETYSKRAVLGCPYPLFILTWHWLALLPAGLDTACAVWRRAAVRKRTARARGSGEAEAEVAMMALGSPPEEEGAGQGGGGQGIQQQQRKGGAPPYVFNLKGVVGGGGGGKQPASSEKEEEEASPWFAQLLWSIYYIAGTLVYTSISTVTAVELVVWVFVSIATTAMSKLLAFSLCMCYERKRGSLREGMVGARQYVPLR